MKTLFLHSILLLFGVCSSSAQNALDKQDLSKLPDSLFVVDSIIIVGNSHTKNFVILREMTLEPGSTITNKALEYNQSRIYSLGLFNQVNIRVMPTIQEKANLLIEVSERWYIFPYPIFGLKDRDWNKLYYGAGLLHSNFRGRNEKLYATFIFGYDPAVGLSYRNPFLSINGSYMIDGRLSYNKIRNKSLQAKLGSDNFDERHFSIYVSLGKRIGIAHTFWLNTGYEIVDVSEYQPLRTISSDGKDKFIVIGASYAYDTRDLYEYPTSGSFAKISITKFGIPSGDVDIVRYSADLRHYIPLISNFTFTSRAFTDLAAAGRTPSYNRTYFGYGERIRGHFNEVMEGENIFGISAELHYPLLSPMYLIFNFLPTEFSVLKFGIVAAVFADAGTVWFRNQPFALNAFSKGYGVGIDFLLPYSFILRTEYARNEIRKGEFIIDVGASF